MRPSNRPICASVGGVRSLTWSARAFAATFSLVKTTAEKSSSSQLRTISNTARERVLPAPKTPAFWRWTEKAFRVPRLLLLRPRLKCCDWPQGNAECTRGQIVCGAIYTELTHHGHDWRAPCVSGRSKHAYRHLLFTEIEEGTSQIEQLQITDLLKWFRMEFDVKDSCGSCHGWASTSRTKRTSARFCKQRAKGGSAYTRSQLKEEISEMTRLRLSMLCSRYWWKNDTYTRTYHSYSAWTVGFPRELSSFSWTWCCHSLMPISGDNWSTYSRGWVSSWHNSRGQPEVRLRHFVAGSFYSISRMPRILIPALIGRSRLSWTQLFHIVLEKLAFLGDTRSRRELLVFAQANPSRLPLTMGILQPEIPVRRIASERKTKLYDAFVRILRRFLTPATVTLPGLHDPYLRVNFRALAGHQMATSSLSQWHY